MQALIDYIESLTVTQGDLLNQPVTVFPWEKRFLKGAFKGGITTSALSIGRGNGKTAFVAAIAAAALDGPLVQPRSEILLVASTLSQARIAYHHCLAFLGDPKANKAKWSTIDSPQKCEIRNKENGVLLRCISSKPEGAHGAAASLILADEPAQWNHNTRDLMLAALETGLGKIPDSRMIALGTTSDDASHWFTKWLAGGADFRQLHAADEKDNPHSRKVWAKANPSMRYLPSLAAAIKRDSDKAKEDADALAMFRSLRLNLPVADTTQAELLTPGQLALCETDSPPAPEGLPVWGVDLGATAAMSAVAAYWPESGRLECLAAFPSIPPLAERGRHDGVGDAYGKMHGRGELITTEGRTVAVSELLDAALERFGLPSAVTADRWRQGELMDAMDGLGLSIELIPRGQGFKDGSEDVRAFRTAVLDGRVKCAPSLLLRSALSGARVVSDVAGNQKLAKSGDGAGRKTRH